MNENMETRTFLGSVEKRANEDNKITITGMPIVFNEVSPKALIPMYVTPSGICTSVNLSQYANA